MCKVNVLDLRLTIPMIPFTERTHPGKRFESIPVVLSEPTDIRRDLFHFPKPENTSMYPYFNEEGD